MRLHLRVGCALDSHQNLAFAFLIQHEGMTGIHVFLRAAFTISLPFASEASLQLLRVQVTRSDVIVNPFLLGLAQRHNFGSRFGCSRSFLLSIVRQKCSDYGRSTIAFQADREEVRSRRLMGHVQLPCCSHDAAFDFTDTARHCARDLLRPTFAPPGFCSAPIFETRFKCHASAIGCFTYYIDMYSTS